MKTRQTLRLTWWCLTALLWVGCSPSPVTYRPPGEETHPHYYAQSRTLGEAHYHAVMEFDPRAGVLGIVFLDENENPVKLLREDKLKASLVVPGKKTRDLELRHPGYPAYLFSSYRVAGYRRPPTDHYVLKDPSLRGLSSFRLKVRIPLGRTTFLVEYEYP